MSPNKKILCTSCDGLIEKKNTIYYGDPHTHYEGKPLCETCYFEDEPIATVYYRNEQEPHFITHARNDTDGDFRAKWHSTDPWRGYFEMESERYARVFSDAILSYHESEAMLKEMNDLVIEKYSENDIDFARAFPRTSNVFSTGFEIWSEKNPVKLLKAYVILNDVKQQVSYDDPLYSTGIIFDRETLGKLQSALGGKYKIEKDSDVLNLVTEKGDGLLEEIKQFYKADNKTQKQPKMILDD